MKNQEAGKFTACLAKAEAKLLQTAGTCSLASATTCYGSDDCPPSESCVKDETKYQGTVDKCTSKFAGKWEALNQKATDAGDPCPDGLAAEDIEDAVSEQVANVAAGLAGNGLSTCSADLLACESDRTTCETDLGNAEAQLSICGGDLSTCQSDLTVCDNVLTTCEGERASAQACGDGDIDAGEDCDQGNLNGASCVGEGFVDGTLRCGANCTIDTSDCYAARFVDHANGTITDNLTGLMWEKKVKLNTTSDLANLQDADNLYRWSGTCSVDGEYCQPDAASAAACSASPEAIGFGCAQCTSGVCNVATPGVTIWQWLAALNAAGFGGHADWRLPTKMEYLSILDDGISTQPMVNAAFHGASCGVTCTDVNDPACSCTRSGNYWSTTTYGLTPSGAWVVAFGAGNLNANTKPNSSASVRAVRGGS